MNAIDRLLQRWRIARARPYVKRAARVLDVGCADGALFRELKSCIGEGVGIDPHLDRSTETDRYRLIAGWFPRDLPDDRPFDIITMLAVLEHVPLEYQPQLAHHCARLLKPGGHLIVTVPSPRVDGLLDVLKTLRLVHGMALEQHFAFDVRKTPSVFSIGGLRLVQAKTFQLGLNNLFVFQKDDEPQT